MNIEESNELKKEIIEIINRRERVLRKDIDWLLKNVVTKEDLNAYNKKQYSNFEKIVKGYNFLKKKLDRQK